MKKLMINASYLEAVSFFIDKNCIRHYLHGVCIEPAKQGVLITATNGNKLLSIHDADGILDGPRVILRVDKGLSSLLHPKKDEEGPRFYCIDEEGARPRIITKNNRSIDTKQETYEDIYIDGTFPDWLRTIPSMKKTESCNIETKGIESFIKAARVATLERNPTLTISGIPNGPAVIQVKNRPQILGLLFQIDNTTPIIPDCFLRDN